MTDLEQRLRELIAGTGPALEPYEEFDITAALARAVLAYRDNFALRGEYKALSDIDADLAKVLGVAP